MEFEFKMGEQLVCPACMHEYAECVEEVKISDGLGIENKSEETCEECGSPFCIIEFEPGIFSVEEIEEDIEYGFEQFDD